MPVGIRLDVAAIRAEVAAPPTIPVRDAFAVGLVLARFFALVEAGGIPRRLPEVCLTSARVARFIGTEVVPGLLVVYGGNRQVFVCVCVCVCVCR